MSEEENNDQLARIEAETMDQMDLALKDEPKVYIDYSERVFDRTAERFVRDDPERAAMAIRLIALGFKNKAIARKVHADTRTIRELRLRAITEVSKQKEELRAIIFPGVALSADRAIELIPSCNNPKDAAITHGILRDSYMQLSGLPQAHIEVNHHFDLGASLRKLEETAMEKMKQAKAHMIEPAALENGEAA